MADDFYPDDYFHILEPIESAVVYAYRDNPDLTDANVDRIYEVLHRSYKAELRERKAPAVAVPDSYADLLVEVKEVCEWSLGRVKRPENIRRKIVFARNTTITLEELLDCLVHLRRSIKLWTGEFGRQGYLDYINRFFQ